MPARDMHAFQDQCSAQIVWEDIAQGQRFLDHIGGALHFMIILHVLLMVERAISQTVPKSSGLRHEPGGRRGSKIFQVLGAF